MHEEVEGLIGAMDRVRHDEHGLRVYHTGSLFGVDAVLVQCRIGKVAAATTATHLISDFGVRAVVFTGVAGGLGPGVRVGDLVVATELVQHDLDASPIFPPLEVPLLNRSRFSAAAGIADALFEGACAFVDAGRHGPAAVHRGVVASGDRFVSSGAERAGVLSRVPDAACVEMEGAAVAQVCYEHGIPFGVVRSISDAADDDAAGSFAESLGAFASRAAVGVLRHALPAVDRL